MVAASAAIKSTEGMPEEITSLRDVCRANLLNTKWLIAPSLRIGHQWIETLVRDGQSVVNLRPTTVSKLALDLAAADLAQQRLELLSPNLGPLIIDSTWSQLARDGYLGRLRQSAALSSAIYESLVALRLAGLKAESLDASQFESTSKARDITVLLKGYEDFLNSHSLVDDADILRRAITQLQSKADSFERGTLILVFVGHHATGLERQFLDSLPIAQRIQIPHPAEQRATRKSDGSTRFFRSVGEINEIREVLRLCLANRKPLDEVEILYTDAQTYLPLIHATARRYFSEEMPDGIPATFAEGIPVSLSRPGRALVAWLQWIEEGYPQRLLIEMISEGLLNCGDEEISFSYLVRLLRRIAIGIGPDNYLPKLEEQIKAQRKLDTREADSEQPDADAVAARERKLKGLKSLQKIVKQLLQLAQTVATKPGSLAFQAVEDFLQSAVRSVNELDHIASGELIEQLRERRVWPERLAVPVDNTTWLATLPSQTRVLGSGPRPGHLHVAPIHSGGSSGRSQTFIVGLDDRRFPGAAIQDPILLDRERSNVSSELRTSSSRLRQKIDDFGATLSRASGAVTLSWSCQDLADDRETFPSSVLLSEYRSTSGKRDADLEALNKALGPPISFAPTTADKALDESERWLWQLGDVRFQGSNQTAVVEARFPHLARGMEAQRRRYSKLGPFNGWVPKAGLDLNPFAADGPVLSASALETAGRCALAYFFRSGLGLYPPDEMELDQDRWLDAAQFGLLLHDVFRQLMSELVNDGKRPEFERDHLRLAKILQDAVERWRKEIPPPNENAFRMQYWQLVRTSQIFLQQEEDFCRNSQPRFFEVALGLERSANATLADDANPAIVVLPNGKTIRTKGQIDRVDETAAHRYSVWDYKVSSGYGYDRADPFQQGRRLQSVLYIRMMERALRQSIDPKAIVDHFGYFFPSIKAHGRRVEWDAGELADGMRILERLCSSIADGVFLATDNEDDCRFCDYVAVCSDLSRVTAHSKDLLDKDLVPLLHLRGLRRE